ncbi:MAG: regulatory protein GemA [Pseudohongiella sp.]|nr:regulatory protein GemA [Pseudohongiella sp.]
MANARSDIAMIKIAIKQLGIPDDDGNQDAGVLSTYRQMLLSLTGKTSVSADVMSDRDRAKVLRALRQKGFKPMPTRRRTRRVKKAEGMLSQGQLGLIYVLWEVLGDGNALESPGKESLCAWVQAYTRKFNSGAGYSAPEFLPDQAAAQVIEQLKMWCRRLKLTWE